MLDQQYVCPNFCDWKKKQSDINMENLFSSTIEVSKFTRPAKDKKRTFAVYCLPFPR